MFASGNELHLAAFREHHEFESFRAGSSHPVPYLLRYPDEQRIYDAQVAPQVGGHVAPHATELAAQFAVLTTACAAPIPRGTRGRSGRRWSRSPRSRSSICTGRAPCPLASASRRRRPCGPTSRALLLETDGAAEYEG
jgi:hypothetical protein